jgi:hypothetical protein
VNVDTHCHECGTTRTTAQLSEVKCCDTLAARDLAQELHHKDDTELIQLANHYAQELANTYNPDERVWVALDLVVLAHVMAKRWQ